MLINVHDKTLSRVTFLDNEKPDTLHYFNDTWHRYLTEATSTFDFSVAKTGNADIEYLNTSGYVSFLYKGQSFLFSIMKIEETETILTCYCENLNLELLNETSTEYKAPVASTFVQYLTLLGLQLAQMEIGINEVSNLSRSLEWTGQDTKLARLLSLVSKFDAECEFATHLNRDGTLDKIVLNVYRKHDDSHQGVGTRRKDVTLYYGKEIKEIRRTVDKTGLYTAIKPIGTDGLNISTLDKTELDEDGNVLFRSPAGDTHILCPPLRDEYPSQVVDPTGDRYINLDWNYDTDNINTLYGQALAKLKSIYMPAISYEVDGFVDLEIGDTIKIHDSGFTPLLLLEARVSEQEISFSQPNVNKTTYSNFMALENKLSADIQSRLEALVQDAIPYTADILTTSGLVFKNGEGSTTLTARVTRGNIILTSLFVQWYKDGVPLSEENTITVNASDVDEKAVYRFEVLDAGGEIMCFAEVTIVDVSDGEPGTPGISPVVTLNIDTSLTIEDAEGTKTTPPLKGNDGENGNDGIIVSTTEPAEPETGQLWQSETGQPIKRWDGTDWVIHYISIENLDVETLSAIAANLGTVTAGTIRNDSGTVIFDVDNGTVEFRGKTDTEIKERLHLHSGVIQLYGHNKDGTGESTGVIDKTGMYCSETMLLQAPKIGMSTDSGTIGDIIAYIINLRSKHVGGAVIRDITPENNMLQLLSYTEVNTILGTSYTKTEISTKVCIQAMNGDVYANNAKVIATCYNTNSGYFNVYFDQTTSGNIRITYTVDDFTT